MSGYDSRKRKRKMRRESRKEEIRRCIEVFSDYITDKNAIDGFPIEDYIPLTWNNRSKTSRD